MLRRDQAAVDEILGERRKRGNDNDDLGDVRSEKFFPPLVRPIKKGASRLYSFDDAAVAACRRNADTVAAGDVTFPAACRAVDLPARVELDVIAAAVRRNDEPRLRCGGGLRL